MKIYLFLSFIMLTVFTFSCASKSDYQQTNFEVNNLRSDMDRLHDDMALFKKAYNPELQKVFSDNVLVAEGYRKSIEKTKNDMEKISDSLNVLLHESENDRMLISENLRTSTTQNVVNEFRQLNNEWKATIFELSNLVRASEKAAESSQHAAMRAAEKAGSAERSSQYITEYMNMVNEQAISLNRIQERIRNLDINIRKISKRLDEIEKPKNKKEKEKGDRKE